MTLEIYIKNRAEFLNQYKTLKAKLPEHNMFKVQLNNFKIRNFKLFIFIFSNDYRHCVYSNTVSSITPIKFIIGKGSYANGIIVKGKSFLDKYPEQLPQIVDYYNKKFKK